MYLEKLKTVSNGSKYEKWYFSIIERAFTRILGGYVEKHHILPKSFNMGGEKDKLNIVKLTAKEHYICHQLLVKMIVDKKLKQKCYCAAWLFSNQSDKFKSSRLYEINRIAIRTIMSEFAIERCTNPEYLQLMSNITTELWKDTEYRAKQTKATETKYTPEVREKMSNITKELMKNPEYYNVIVTSLRKTHENIDHTTKEWTERSFNSAESLRKSKEYSQSTENRKWCSERELIKGGEALSSHGRKMQQAQIDKFESAEDYKSYMSSINKGRKRIVNMTTFEVKNIRDTELPNGWKYSTSLNKHERELFKTHKYC